MTLIIRKNIVFIHCDFLKCYNDSYFSTINNLYRYSQEKREFNLNENVLSKNVLVALGLICIKHHEFQLNYFLSKSEKNIVFITMMI